MYRKSRARDSISKGQVQVRVGLRGRKLTRIASARRTSVQIHCTALNLTLLESDGKSKLKTVISYSMISRYSPKLLGKGLGSYRKHIIHGRLCVTWEIYQQLYARVTSYRAERTGAKSCPRSGTPPSYNKSE